MSCRAPYLIFTRRLQWMLFSAGGGEAHAVQFVLAFVSSDFLSFALFSFISFTRFSVGLSDLLYVKPRGHKSTVCCSGDGGTLFYFERVLLSTLAWQCDISQTPTINRVIFLRNIRHETIIHIAAKKEKFNDSFSFDQSWFEYALKTRKMLDLHNFHLSHGYVRLSYAFGWIQQWHQGKHKDFFPKRQNRIQLFVQLISISVRRIHLSISNRWW